MGAFLTAIMWWGGIEAGMSVLDKLLIPYLTGESDLPELQRAAQIAQARNQETALQRRASKEETTQRLEKNVNQGAAMRDLRARKMFGGSNEGDIAQLYDVLGLGDVGAPAAPTIPPDRMAAATVNGIPNADLLDAIPQDEPPMVTPGLPAVSPQQVIPNGQ